MTIVIAAAAFVVVISFLVIFHELGHYSVARAFGVIGTDFSLGFGPSIFSIKDKSGTSWSLSPILLGGYVKFPPEDSPEGVPTLERLARWKKALVVAAGPAVNLVIGVLIFASLAGTVGFPIGRPVIETIQSGSPAEGGGLKVGDLIRRIDNRKMISGNDVTRAVAFYPGKLAKIEYERSGILLDTSIRLGTKPFKDELGNTATFGFLGITMPVKTRVANSVPEALSRGVSDMQMLVNAQLVSLHQIVTGKRNLLEMSGPIRLARSAGQAASNGWVPFLYLTAIVSVAIGTINLLPLPAFDGGHITRYAIEGIMRRDVSQAGMKWISMAGFVMIVWMGIMAITLDIIATANV